MRSRTRVILLGCTALMLLLCRHWSVSAAETPAAITGNYTIIARGYLQGSGHAAVGAHSVTINAKVIDADGNEGRLLASNLKMLGNRFSGTGTANGQAITISGRVDPAGGALHTPRITCTYGAGDGKSGRIVGTRRH